MRCKEPHYETKDNQDACKRCRSKTYQKMMNNIVKKNLIICQTIVLKDVPKKCPTFCDAIFSYYMKPRNKVNTPF